MCRQFFENCLPDLSQIQRLDLFFKNAAVFFLISLPIRSFALNDFQKQISQMRVEIEN